MSNLYSARAEERRRQFNKIINGCNMVLMNNIPEVDPSVWDNWQGENPVSEQCNIEDNTNDTVDSTYYCSTHKNYTNEEYECENYEGETEVYQWYAVGDSDADFLKRHGQYITYSDTLDTYFLAITHCGTAWDYVEPMVSAFDDMYTGLKAFDDGEDK